MTPILRSLFRVSLIGMLALSFGVDASWRVVAEELGALAGVTASRAVRVAGVMPAHRLRGLRSGLRDAWRETPPKEDMPGAGVSILGFVPVRGLSGKAGSRDDGIEAWGLPDGKEHDFADPTDDFPFKAMFRREENKDLLRNFLNNVLSRKGENEIVELHIRDPDADSYYDEVKQFSFDVLCVDKSGEHYIVEMEKDAFKQHSKPGFFKRLQAYTGRAYSEQLTKGTSYRELNPVICIVLANTKVFHHPDAERYLSRHVILDEETHEQHFRDMMWVVVEIPKFPKGEDELETELDQWMYLFRNAKGKRHLPVKIGSPYVRKAYKVLDKATWTDDERAAALREEIAYFDRKSIVKVAEERGEEQALINLAQTWNGKGKTVAQIADLLDKDETWVNQAITEEIDENKDERS
ncbi:MAG: Rpn family recombination-promoting nuclease/putative transposase [Alphaproteobacteria bacterium]|nr:MAG: Rpn family recombination-promoting nuclease/putative transposase [Alphaproteobacteria bacterium]